MVAICLPLESDTKMFYIETDGSQLHKKKPDLFVVKYTNFTNDPFSISLFKSRYM